MLVAYDSRTGNVRRFVEKLKLPAIKIDESTVVDEPFVMVTYTTGFGEAPDKVMKFLQKNHRYLQGVASSGNRNWGTGFAKSADRISQLYGVPVLHKFELSGTERDAELLRKEVLSVAAY